MKFTIRDLLCLMVVVVSSGAVVGSVAVAKVKAADEVLAPVQGKWRCMAAECEGKKDPAEEGDVWTVSDKMIRAVRTGGVVTVAEYTIDASRSPATIDWTSTDEAGTKWIGKGIIKCDGRSLQLCGQVAPEGEAVTRPKEFATRRGDEATRMLLFSRVE